LHRYSIETCAPHASLGYTAQAWEARAEEMRQRCEAPSGLDRMAYA